MARKLAAGIARLGPKSALITRVGNNHMGRHIREEQFPLMFYRSDCAEMARKYADLCRVWSDARSHRNETIETA